MRKGSIVYFIALLTPLALRFLVDGTLSNVLLGLGVLFFIGYLIYITSSSHRTLSNTLAMGFEREARTVELRAENARREAREAELQGAREKAE